MKKRILFALLLLIFLTTINSQKSIVISKFNLEEIIIDNNFLVNDEEVKKLLAPIYNKNLIFLKNKEIEKLLTQNSYIESFIIKKKYPDTLKIQIHEKQPIAILVNKKNKFFLSEKIDLIEFTKNQNYRNLPYIFGNKEDFKILFNELKKINFPFEIIKKYTLYESNRWDLETFNNKVIKLPTSDYIKSLKNYLDNKDKVNFIKYKVFDYRIQGQLILK
tara:strand:- start:2895 stop:3551 length:657 start_codon:yes stop_codon:yes gene_type:complete